jgi:hypothetical protein
VTTWLLAFITVVFLLEAFRRRDPLLFGIGWSVAVFYTLRSVILRSGWEPAEPPYLFGGETGGLYAQVDLILCLWLVCMLLIPMPQLDGTWRPMDAEPPPSGTTARRIRVMPIALVVVASSVWLVVSSGGFEAAQRLVRLGDGGGGGTGIFLAAPSVLLVVAIWQVRCDITQRAKPSAAAIVALAASFISFFLLGSRTPIIAGLLALAIGGIFRMRVRARYSARIVLLLLVTAIAVPQLAIGLRALRDEAITRGESGPAAGATVSKALNAIYYDGFALVVRDLGVLFSSQGPSLFLDGTLSVIPRALWPDKPDYKSVGKWLRLEYEPERINGWPTGAPGEWYLMLGLIGIPIGALLTVLAARAVLRIAASLDRDSGIELSALWSLVVFKGGMDTEFFARAIVWIGLPVAYILIMRVRGDMRLPVRR